MKMTSKDMKHLVKQDMLEALIYLWSYADECSDVDECDKSGYNRELKNQINAFCKRVGCPQVLPDIF